MKCSPLRVVYTWKPASLSTVMIMACRNFMVFSNLCDSEAAAPTKAVLDVVAAAVWAFHFGPSLKSLNSIETLTVFLSIDFHEAF